MGQLPVTDAEHLAGVLELRTRGIAPMTAITALMQVVAKLADEMDLTERHHAAVLIAHFNGKVAEPIAGMSGVS